MERTFKVSVETAREWLGKLAQSTDAPAWVRMAIVLIGALKNKTLEITVRAVDE